MLRQSGMPMCADIRALTGAMALLVLFSKGAMYGSRSIEGRQGRRR